MRKFLLLSLIIGLYMGCIEDDIVFDEVDPVLRIISSVDSIELDTEFQFMSRFFDNVGNPQDVVPSWSSSNDEIISITSDGLARAQSLGSATITATFNTDNVSVSDSRLVHVGQSTTIGEGVFEGSIQSTSSYTLTGNFTYSSEDNGVKIVFGQDYRASSTLPGLYIYLTNNPATTANALEIGKVTTFSGAHEYFVEDIGFEDFSHILYFCKPFNVKVGDGSLR